MVKSAGTAASSKKKQTTLRQGKLDFSAKRSTAGSTVKGKVAAKSATPSVNTSNASTPFTIDDDSEYEEDEYVSIPKAKKAKGPVAKRRKVEPSATPDGKPEAKDKDKGVSKPREGVENTGGGPTPPVEDRPTLRPGDKAWNKIYRDAKSKMGNTQPVHSENQNKVHQILRVFDLSYEYGPCVGVSRLQRWERAEALGLSPPPEIKQILTTKEGTDEEEYSQCVFYGDL